MSYSFSEDELADIDEVWSYTAGDDISAADRLIASFIAALKLLAERPLIGHQREGWSIAPCRSGPSAPTPSCTVPRQNPCG